MLERGGREGQTFYLAVFLESVSEEQRATLKERAFAASVVVFIFLWLRIILRNKEPVDGEPITRWRTWWEMV